jgi:hypothetical protein
MPPNARQWVESASRVRMRQDVGRRSLTGSSGPFTNGRLGSATGSTMLSFDTLSG